MLNEIHPVRDPELWRGQKTKDISNGVKLSVIIPAYNEERRLPKTLREIDKYLSRQTYSYEVLVVSDGSQDKTPAIVRERFSDIRNLRLIANKENHGKGYVVRQGMLEARGEYRLFTDADNSTSIDHLEKMWPYFEQGFEVVIGSREAKDAPGARQAISQPFWKRMLGDFGNLIIRFLAVPGIRDTQCGFKAFTAKAAQDIFPRMIIDRWGFDIEVLAVARKLGYKIAIIPVYWINDPESKVSLKGYVQVFFEVLKIRINLIKGVYDQRKN